MISRRARVSMLVHMFVMPSDASLGRLFSLNHLKSFMNSSEFFMWHAKGSGVYVFKQFTNNFAKPWEGVFLQFAMGLIGSLPLCNLIKPLMEGRFGSKHKYVHPSPHGIIEALSCMHCLIVYWYCVQGSFARIRKVISEMYSSNFILQSSAYKTN
jgi:hypothetical protein